MNVYRRRRTSSIRRLRSRWIPSQNLLIAETIDNVGVASQTLYIQAIADSDIHSGSATLALTVEATKEAKDTSASISNRLGLDATADTDNSSATATTFISDFQTEAELNTGTGAPTISESTSEYISSSASATILTSDFQTETEISSGTGGATIADALAEIVTNSATATITLDETIITPTQTAVARLSLESGVTPSSQTNHAIKVRARVTSGAGTIRVALYEGVNNRSGDLESSTLTTSLANYAISIPDANAATITDYSNLEIRLWGYAAAGGSIDFEVDQIYLETPVPSTAEDTLDNIGSSSFSINESEKQNGDNSGANDPKLSESIAETIDSVGTGTPRIADIIPEPDMVSVGSGTQFISESTAETISNSTTSAQTIAEAQPGDDLGNTGTGTVAYSEAIAEIIASINAGTQTLAESIAEQTQNNGINTPSPIDIETDTPVNTGTGNHYTDAEKISEMDTVAFLASLTMDDQRNISVVPFSDLSTGTWTVDPLYEKVDELIALGGYPTESIRSANNPINDTAVLGLAPVSDPGIDTEHYINIQFYKQGAETLDFTVNLKEGGTLIATRTFTDVQETVLNPRVERISLTTEEVDDIVDYSNLRIELIANQTS